MALAKGSGAGSLVFAGLVAMQDPPRAKVADSIDILAQSGVRTLMLTGDAKETAVAIAHQIRLINSSSNYEGQVAVSGPELDKYSDDDLKELVEVASVYYRVTPRHKLRIVKALQSHGHIVAMTGDGVNDGVAVKCADVGDRKSVV